MAADWSGLYEASILNRPRLVIALAMTAVIGLGWFAKGLPGASRFRHTLRHIDSEAVANALISDYAATLDNDRRNGE